MAASYLREGMSGEATFSLFIRKYPQHRGYFVAAGLELAAQCADLGAPPQAVYLPAGTLGTAVGLALGPIRVLWLEPRLGVTLAVLCETPFLLAAMIFAARWVPRKTGLGNDLAPLALMGIGALALQQAADLGVGIWLRGLAPGQQYAGLATPAGAVYLALLVVFAVLPAALNAGRRHT